MNKLCKSCRSNFEITDKDQSFYARLETPLPDYCPSCRMQRRLAHRNERTLYRRNCDLCKQPIVAIYPAKTPWPVYCAPCWNGDGWDAKTYAMDYDPAKPFFEQWSELQNRVPRIGLLNFNSVNSDFTNNSGYNKNCYLLFAAENNEDAMYGRLIQRSKFVVDVAWVYDSELCYECMDCRFCYSCLFSERCQNSSDLLFCFSLRDSKNCILCTNLHHKEYCIENKQCTKEEYEARRAQILSSRDEIEKARQKFDELRSQTLVKFAFQTKCTDATGDYIHNCEEVKMVFDSTSAKASAYLSDTENAIDCYDGNNMYFKPELCLDVMGQLQCLRAKFCTYVFYCNEAEYCNSCYNSESLFGCIGLKKTSFSILNKQYPPEEYKKLRRQIIESLEKEGLYGQFLPMSVSPFGYNETLAKDYFPLTREQVVAAGFKWQSETTGTSGKETVVRGQVPKAIGDVTDKILSDVLVCENCNLNFRITSGELSFYRKLGLPLPVKCFECRHQARLAKRNPRNLWHRQCMCDGVKYKNIARHEHPSQCPNVFETAYAPERPEIVYCEQCYQAEVT